MRSLRLSAGRTEMSLAEMSPENNFGGARVADRVQEGGLGRPD